MSISRRAFLLGVGAGVAAVAGCDPEPGPAGAPGVARPVGPGRTTGTTTGVTTAAPSAGPSTTEIGPGAVQLDAEATIEAAGSDWIALRSKLDGGLLLPGERGFDVAKRAFNPLFDGRKPAAVAKVANSADVRVCVNHAREKDVPIAARSGGHSYAGYSTPRGGLIVDVAGIRGVRVRDDGTAVIGAGTRLAQVYRELAAKGRCLPGGSCPTVGIAGLTLGGGVGVLTRKYGLTCDQLRSAKLVTADGTIITASEDSHPDLFWALRGGGGGNFGVVTSFTFATAPAPRLTVFSLRFAPGQGPDVLGAWQRWIAHAPRELWSTMVISAGSPPSCRVGGCFVGSSAKLNRLLDALVRTAGVRPSARSVSTKSYLDAMRYFAGCSTLSARECRPRSAGGVLDRAMFVGSSRVVGRPVRDPAKVVGVLNGRSGMDLILDSLGGRVAAVAPDATAFPHRKALASAQIYAGCTAATAHRTYGAVRSVRDRLAPLVGGTGYVNYIDASMPRWGAAYYGGNADRLRSVARRYDPDRVFDFAQSALRA